MAAPRGEVAYQRGPTSRPWPWAESFCRALAGALGASTRALRSLESSPARKLASVTRVLGTGAHSTSEIIWALTRTAADGSQRETLCRLLYGWGLFVSSCGATHVPYWYSPEEATEVKMHPLSSALQKVRGHRTPCGWAASRRPSATSSPFSSSSLRISPPSCPSSWPTKPSASLTSPRAPAPTQCVRRSRGILSASRRRL